MSNNTFQLDRFSKVMARTIKQNKKIGLISILVFTGIPLLLFLFNMISLQPTALSTRTAILSLLVTFTFVLSPFIYFYGVNHPKKGLSEVMLPASILEKYINMMFFCMIVAPLAAFALYTTIDSLIAFIFPKYVNGYVINEFETIFSWDQILWLNLFMQSIFFFNLFFSRQKILKSIGASMIIGIVSIVFIVIFVDIAERNGLLVDDFYVSSINHRSMFEFYRNDPFLLIYFQFNRIFTLIVLPIGLMIASYFVLKNKRY